MTRILVCTLLLAVVPIYCQQQPKNTAQTDQTEQPLQDKAAGNERIQSNLQSAFDGDPTLRGAQVAAAVDDQSVTLTGTVQSFLQHQRVLQLVSPYDSYRTIVDNLTVQ